MRSGLYIMALLCGLASSQAFADSLTIPGHIETIQKQTLPQRGKSMDSVLNEFGDPVERYEAVGEPPISEWVYADFRVYFEHQFVLHAIDMTTLVIPK